MIEEFFKLFGINIKKRIEETPANFEMEINTLELVNGKLKIKGKIKLDFPGV